MSFEANLERVESRHRELEGMLSSTKALNAEEITKISKELSELAPIAEKVLELRSIENELNEAKNMLSDKRKTRKTRVEMCFVVYNPGYSRGWVLFKVLPRVIRVI